MRKLFFTDENCNSDKPGKDASIPPVIIVVISEKFILSLIMGYRTLEFIISNFEKGMSLVLIKYVRWFFLTFKPYSV